MESGHTPSREHPEYWNGGIPWLGVRDAGKNHGAVINDTSEHTNQRGIDNSSARLLPAGTVCLSRGGTVGYVVMLGRPMCTSQGFANWICGPELDARFLMHLLLSEKSGLDRFAIGTTIQTIYYPDLKALHVCIPSLSEQQRIVRLLDEAFEGIAIAKANAEKNLQNARALFKSQLQSVFTQRGNGWTDRALEEICSVSAGNSAPQDPGYFTEGTIPFFRTSDAGRIKFGTIYESQDKLNSHGASKLRRYPAGTILFPKSGASTFLNHRVVLGVEGCVSSHLATIVPDPDHVLPQFLLYALTLIDAKDLIQDQSYPSLNLPAIENIRIYLPPLNEQQQIVRLLDELQIITDKLARICSAKQASLEELKESLLHQAFSGNLEAA